MVTLLLDLVFLRFPVWATFKGLAAGLSVLPVWRTVMSVPRPFRRETDLRRPRNPQGGGNSRRCSDCGGSGIAAIYKSVQSACRLSCFADNFQLDVPDTL